MARILVIIEKGENSYGAYSPDVPGCVAVGDTREEVEQLMKEALQEHLQMMREENLPLPQSQTECCPPACVARRSASSRCIKACNSGSRPTIPAPVLAT